MLTVSVFGALSGWQMLKLIYFLVCAFQKAPLSPPTEAPTMWQMLCPFTGGPFQMGLSTVSLLEPRVPWGRIQGGLMGPQPGGKQCIASCSSSSSQLPAFSFLSRSQVPGFCLPPAGNYFRGKGTLPLHLTRVGDGELRAQQELSPKTSLHISSPFSPCKQV